MKFLKLLIPFFLLSQSVVFADETSREGGVLPTEVVGMGCDNGTNTGRVQCDGDGNVSVVQGGSSTEAVFATVARIAGSAMAGTYSGVAAPAAGTRVVVLDNQTDGSVWVSMDDGTTNHFHLLAGDALTLNLAESGVTATANVKVKDGEAPIATSGYFVMSSYK